MTVLVTGATGRVGDHILQGLLAAGVPARGLCRDPQRARPPAGTEVVSGDLSQPASLASALRGVRAVFLYAQTQSLAGQMQVMRDAGVEQVVVLSTIDAANPRPYARHNRERHRAVEDAVAAAGFRHTFLRPGAFASNALRFWGSAIAAGGPVPMAFPESKQAPIDERDIAGVAIWVLASRDFDGQAIELSGPQSLTQRQQLSILAAVLGRNLEVRQETEEEARTRLSAIIPHAYVELLLAQWADEVHEVAAVTDSVERVTGRPARTYAEWAQRHAALFARAP